MDFSTGTYPSSPLEVLSAYWPFIAIYGVLLGIGIVRIVRRPMVPAFSPSRRARKEFPSRGR